LAIAFWVLVTGYILYGELHTYWSRDLIVFLCIFVVIGGLGLGTLFWFRSGIINYNRDRDRIPLQEAQAQLDKFLEYPEKPHPPQPLSKKLEEITADIRYGSDPSETPKPKLKPQPEPAEDQPLPAYAKDYRTKEEIEADKTV